MSPAIRCPQCGAPLTEGAQTAPCPACLMQLGFESWRQSDADRIDSEEDPCEARVAFASGTGNELPNPEELGRYFPSLEILGLVGRGGMGAVYKVRQRELDRVVALKIILPDVASDPGFSERFTREARVLARLNHPRIVTIHDFGKRGELYFLVMEFVDGVNLRELLRAKKLPPSEALGIIPKLCEALQFAHDAGVVHRDIKPENILVDRKGNIKIADFGLAKLAGAEPSRFQLTGTRQIVGTLHYMAPEQMQGSRGVDHRADIYSLGVVFYEMLTGELPVGKFEPPSQRAPVDARIDSVVLRTLERDPQLRYQHASDVKIAVESIVREEPAVTVAWPPIGVDGSRSQGFPSAWSDFNWVWKLPRRISPGWRLGLGIAAIALCLLLVLSNTPFGQRRLVAAATAGDFGLVDFWLAIGVDANARDERGETALFRAAGEGQTGSVERLLAHGATIDLANGSGETPLMWAAWQGQENAVAFLLQHHANVNQRSRDQETALHKAAFRGHTVIVKSLLDAGLVIDETDEDGETALILAAAQGSLPITTLLLARGANPRAATRDGWTPLMLAARNGHQAIVELLLPVSRVSDVGAKGETALGMALFNGNAGVIELLLDSGAEETGALWLWRGIRFARSGQFVEALPCFERAASDAAISHRVWSVTIEGVRYDVPTPTCFAWLVLGTCQQQIKQSSEAGTSYKKGLENAPESSGPIVLLHRVRQSPGQTEIERIEVTREEIRRHVENPATAWQIRVQIESDEQHGSSRSHSTRRSEQEVRSFF